MHDAVPVYSWRCSLYSRMLFLYIQERCSFIFMSLFLYSVYSGRCSFIFGTLFLYIQESCFFIFMTLFHYIHDAFPVYLGCGFFIFMKLFLYIQECCSFIFMTLFLNIQERCSFIFRNAVQCVRIQLPVHIFRYSFKDIFVQCKSHNGSRYFEEKYIMVTWWVAYWAYPFVTCPQDLILPNTA